ncbi:hypothetical protein HYU15_02160, partial [Candidatus Woesearchaeota archaeon]|nr:hypothetical protein [Candidatus Woesearchaeota archaeon]
MAKLKRILMNVRVWIVLVALLVSLYALAPNPLRDGAAIRSVEKDSAAFLAGMTSPLPTDSPAGRERVVSVNNAPVKGVKDYYDAVGKLPPNRSVQVKTTKGIYRLTTQPLVNVTVLPELVDREVAVNVLENVTVNDTVVAVNKTVIKTERTNRTIEKVVGTEDLGLKVYDAPKTNIRLGLDLQGGTRVLLQPEEKIPSGDLLFLIGNMKQRLNVFGLSDVVIREATDLTGNQYVLVEIAGVNEGEVRELLAKQGKFEAKIANSTVFRGGSDITYVCRSAECSGIDPGAGCGESNSQWFCGFRFAITLSSEAAQRQAAATRDLSVAFAQGSQGSYLNESLELYLDDRLVDTLRIGSELKGRPVTDISISGSGAGVTQQDAVASSLENMRRLQTILITGSLPVKMNIIKTDTVSPLVGEKFASNALLLAVLAAIAVGATLFLAYRKVTVAVPILLTSLVEILIMMGIASIIGWNIDLAAVAGIIAAVGTGVNDQIIITDEALRGEA